MPSTSHPDGQGGDASTLRSLLALTELALSGRDLDATFDVACEVICHRLDAQRAGVFEARGGDEQCLLLRAGAGWRIGEAGTLRIPSPADDPLLREQTTLPVTADGRDEFTKMLLGAGGVTVPLSDPPFGVLMVLMPRHTAPSDDDLRFVADVAATLRSAIERATLESSLIDSRHQLQMAQELANLGSYDWHIASDTNTWSDELFRIYGLEPGAIDPTYDTFLSLLHPDDRERVRAIHERAFRTREPYQMEERIVRPDGSIRVLLSNGRVVTDEHGTPSRMMGICLDITEQREAERLARTTRELEEARERAMTLNDNVVQGLATALYALEQGRPDLAELATRATLESARDMAARAMEPSTEAPAPRLVRVAPPAPTLTDSQDPAATERGRSGSPRVLIVDDSDDIRLMLRMMLGGDPRWRVCGEAENGDDALALVRSEQPEVVLLDLAMPGTDGLEVIRQIRREGIGTTIVVLSGFKTGHLSEEALRAGADLYLEKGMPIDRMLESLELVTRVIEERSSRA